MFLACPSSIRVGVRQGSFWLEFCHSEKLPPTVKLTLLQTAVRSINDLRIVETLDEFQSTTYGHGSSTSLSYETYYDLLINACVRYDKTKRDNIGKGEMSTTQI